MEDELIKNYEQPIKFVIGFAGSGKSTRLSKDATDTTLVLVPTHKAADVLINKGVKNVFTIHSVLKLVPTLNQNFRRGQRLQRLQRMGTVDLSDITSIFIDEYSMISYEILDMLLNILPEHTKVTIFGDSYQLPPIDGAPIEADFFTEDIENLTTQHRADAPEVIETFMRFKGYLDGTGEKNLKLNPSIQYGSLDGFNPATDRILAFTNEKVLELNSIVSNNKDIQKGDAILVNGIDGFYLSDDDSGALMIFPKCISKGKLMDSESLSLTSLATINDIEKYRINLTGYDIGKIKINNEDYIIYFDKDHYASATKLKREVEELQALVIDTHKLGDDVHIPTWCKNNRDAKYVKERGFAWTKYISHTNLVFDMRRPYATTVHKAQGSEFQTIYLAHRDIKKSIKNNYYDTYARLMYVALSRATKKVILI